MLKTEEERRQAKQRCWIEHNQKVIDEMVDFQIEHLEMFSDDELVAFESAMQKQQEEFRRFVEGGGVPIFRKETNMFVIPSVTEHTEKRNQEETN